MELLAPYIGVDNSIICDTMYLKGGVRMDTYKPSEFARKIGVCLKTLQRWDKQGIFPAKRTPTGMRYYTEEDLNKYFGQEVKYNVKN